MDTHFSGKAGSTVQLDGTLEFRLERCLHRKLIAMLLQSENSGEEIDLIARNPLYFFRSLISSDPASKTE